MASNLKNLDSVGGFSVDNTTIVNELKDIQNVNSLEVKNSFFSDGYTAHYIMRGVNSTILSLDDVASTIILPSDTINFIEASIIGVNDNASAHISQKLETVVQVDGTGSVSELSTMSTIIKDSVPVGQSFTVAPFTGGAANRYSYVTSRTGTTRSVKWSAYVKVVSITR